MGKLETKSGGSCRIGDISENSRASLSLKLHTTINIRRARDEVNVVVGSEAGAYDRVLLLHRAPLALETGSKKLSAYCTNPPILPSFALDPVDGIDDALDLGQVG